MNDYKFGLNEYELGLLRKTAEEKLYRRNLEHRENVYQDRKATSRIHSFKGGVKYRIKDHGRKIPAKKTWFYHCHECSITIDVDDIEVTAYVIRGGWEFSSTVDTQYLIDKGYINHAVYRLFPIITMKHKAAFLLDLKLCMERNDRRHKYCYLPVLYTKPDDPHFLS